MSHLQLTDRSLYYIELGKGYPVVLLHSLGGSGRDWFFQIQELIDAGYRVIIPDITGHGASSPLTQPVNLSQLARDVWAIMDALDIFDAHLIGVSLGGLIALMAASQRTQRVNKLVLINSLANTKSVAFMDVLPTWTKELNAETGAVKWFEDSWLAMVKDDFRNAVIGLQAYQLYHSIAASNNGISIANVLTGITGLDIADRIKSIKAPALLLTGEDDPASASTPPLTALLPSARHVVIPGGKHLINIDSSALVNKYMLDFLLK